MFTWQHCARRSATTRGLRPTSKPSCGQGIASSLQSGLIRATRRHSHRAPWRVPSNFTSLSAAAGLTCCQVRTSSCRPPWTPFVPRSRSIRPMHRRTPAWRAHGAVQAVFRAVPHQEAFTEAKASALRALAMDSASADAQVALGTVLFLSEWDWTAAERSLQRALEINPDHTEALLQYGSLQEALGRLDDGLRCKQQALARDPRSPGVLVQIAISYWHQRKYDETQVWAQRALEVDPKHVLACQFINARLLEDRGRQ